MGTCLVMGVCLAAADADDRCQGKGPRRLLGDEFWFHRDVTGADTRLNECRPVGQPKIIHPGAQRREMFPLMHGVARILHQDDVRDRKSVV